VGAELRFTIVYDNNDYDPRLETKWGFSCLIEGREKTILFDTGGDSATLLKNMKRLGIDPRHIGAIVISHAHGDHSGGLSGILEMNRIAEIYVPASTVARVSGRKVVRVSQPVEISETVFSTGELGGIEQSLAIKTSKGVVVVAGCSHPGVGVILDAASHYGKGYGILGGLHGFHDFSRLEGLSLICPCHCTQYKSELKRLFPEQYVSCGAGLELEI
jgi:7,8-dihydropterin-6-yl-methyl-4-(beta-D-ribofuranosyl)aminobenzene 5'-phosphate synthase